MDDNFSSIVAAVKWGRGVYANIRKFLQFQLTVNVVALVVAFVGAVSDRGTPLTAVQLLWVNMIMDTLGALALGTEIPTEALLKDKPYGRYDRLISATMWRNIFGQAIFQVTVLFGVLYLGSYIWGVEDGSRYHYTLLFNTFVFCQVFNEFNARKVGSNEMNIFANLGGSLPFVFIIVGTIGLQLLLVSFGGEFVKVVPLSALHWLTNIAIGACSFLVGFVLRTIPVPKLKPAERPPPPKLSVMEESDEEGAGGEGDSEEISREDRVREVRY